jgi:DNA-binding beta-propeller fold protein YncE
MRRNRYVGLGFVAAIILLGAASAVLDKRAALEAAAVQAPMFEVDPLWPKPLPNHWVIGMAIGVAVDAQDHVWVLHRPQSLANNEKGAALERPIASCCFPAPPVLEFDQAGNLVGHWGGPGQGYEWPQSNHGITIDYKGNVWIGGNGPKDSHIVKFTQSGKFLLQIGQLGKGQGSNDTENLRRATEVSVDRAANEVYVADGYGNRRVIVYDADNGKYKRHWGAYGNKPDDTDLGPYDPNAPPAKQFRTPVHCAELSNDGLVYTCDRTNDRIQVFKKDGTFLKEGFVSKNTLGAGSVWDIAFSKVPQQKYIYVADGQDSKVFVLLRDTLEVLTSFGDGGRQPGQFYGVHNVATDSKGNIYTSETYEGRRLQKFVYKGLGAVTKKDQGTVWPKRT